MKYRVPVPPPQKVNGRLGKLVGVFSKIEPYFVRSVLSTPVFSKKDKTQLVKQFGEIQERCVDGLSREQQSLRMNEVLEPEHELFGIDDTALRMKLENKGQELQYIVSLGLHTIERLYLTNNLSEDLYFKYRRVLRFLPKFHEELVRRSEMTDRN